MVFPLKKDIKNQNRKCFVCGRDRKHGISPHASLLNLGDFHNVSDVYLFCSGVMKLLNRKSIFFAIHDF